MRSCVQERDGCPLWNRVLRDRRCAQGPFAIREVPNRTPQRIEGSFDHERSAHPSSKTSFNALLSSRCHNRTVESGMGSSSSVVVPSPPYWEPDRICGGCPVVDCRVHACHPFSVEPALIVNPTKQMHPASPTVRAASNRPTFRSQSIPAAHIWEATRSPIQVELSNPPSRRRVRGAPCACPAPGRHSRTQDPGSTSTPKHPTTAAKPREVPYRPRSRTARWIRNPR